MSFYTNDHCKFKKPYNRIEWKSFLLYGLDIQVFSSRYKKLLIFFPFSFQINHEKILIKAKDFFQIYSWVNFALTIFCKQKKNYSR